MTPEIASTSLVGIAIAGLLWSVSGPALLRSAGRP